MYPKNLPLVFNRFASAIFGDAGEEGAKNSRNKPTFSIPYVISMANNRIMNFGHIAFDQETLPARDTLPGDAYVVSIGRSILDAAQTARIPLYSHESNYVNCIAVGTACSGTLPNWRAISIKSGMIVLPAIDTPTAVQKVVKATANVLHANNFSRQHPGDLLVLSIHWGLNWAYREQRPKLFAASTLTVLWTNRELT